MFVAHELSHFNFSFLCVFLYSFRSKLKQNITFFYDAETITMFLIKNIAVIIVCKFLYVSEFFILYPLRNVAIRHSKFCGKL